MRSIILSILFLLAVQCQSEQGSLLIGTWQAVELTENGKPIVLDLSPVSFEFSENGRYRFSSTLNQGEAGSYFVQSNQLHTTDTLHQASVPKKVQILHLSSDSLRLKMQAEAGERILTLVKGKENSAIQE